MRSPIDYIKQDPLLSSFVTYKDSITYQHSRILEKQYNYTEINDLDKNSENSVFVQHFNPHLTFEPINVSVPKIFTSEFFKSFSSEYNPQSDQKFDLQEILFPGIRYLAPGIVVFERPPAHHVISVAQDYRDAIGRDTDKSTYYIPIPWQVYVCLYNPNDMRLFSVKMFFTHSSLTNIDQPIYAPPIFNFYADGSLCRPFFDSIEDVERYPQNVSGVIASAFDWIWNSGYNLDITDNINFFLTVVKGQFQFDQYVSDQMRDVYNSFARIKYHSLGSNLSFLVSNAFFRLWESLPIEIVSNLTWNPISRTHEFWYSLYRDNLSSIIEQYAKANNLFLSECDHECHCDDCCEDDESVYECARYHEDMPNNNIVTYDYVRENVNLYPYFYDLYCSSLNNTLSSVIESSIKLLEDTGLFTTKSTNTVFGLFQSKISSILS